MKQLACYHLQPLKLIVSMKLPDLTFFVSYKYNTTNLNKQNIDSMQPIHYGIINITRICGFIQFIGETID